LSRLYLALFYYFLFLYGEFRMAISPSAGGSVRVS